MLAQAPGGIAARRDWRKDALTQCIGSLTTPKPLHACRKRCAVRVLQRTGELALRRSTFASWAPTRIAPSACRQPHLVLTPRRPAGHMCASYLPWAYVPLQHLHTYVQQPPARSGKGSQAGASERAQTPTGSQIGSYIRSINNPLVKKSLKRNCGGVRPKSSVTAPPRKSLRQACVTLRWRLT